MARYLEMSKRQDVLAALRLGWSFRRIERELGVHRQTVRRLAQAPPAKCTPAPPDLSGVSSGGSAERPTPAAPPASARSAFRAAVFAADIARGLDAGLTAQRIYQDLVEQHDYAGSYDSVKRYVRRLKRATPPRPVGVMHHAPGEEAQVDYFLGAPTQELTTGRWKRPWVFRMTLCHSRHGYEEAVWRLDLPTFLRLHEHAFRDFGGVPRVIRHDNTKTGVARACRYDPDTQVVYEAFAQHWGFESLPTQPHHPQENGKEERAGGYCKHNACAGHRFPALEAQNTHLRQWNRRWARTRIHGTTRRQVWRHFVEVDQPALRPCPADDFGYFECGQRTVHLDGHVEVAGAFYPVPPTLLGQTVQARWDDRLVRLYHAHVEVALYARLPPGRWALPPGRDPDELQSSQRARLQQLLGRCSTLGPELRAWADAAHAARGIRTFRLLQGVLALARTHSRAQVLRAAQTALTYRRFRYAQFQQLLRQPAPPPPPRELVTEHPVIRPMAQYALRGFLSPAPVEESP